MSTYVSDIAFTPAVKAAQERLGSRKAYANVEKRGSWTSVVTPELEAFIAERDSLYFLAEIRSEHPSFPAWNHPVGVYLRFNGDGYDVGRRGAGTGGDHDGTLTL